MLIFLTDCKFMIWICFRRWMNLETIRTHSQNSKLKIFKDEADRNRTQEYAEYKKI
jgi:hypothetical protein